MSKTNKREVENIFNITHTLLPKVALPSQPIVIVGGGTSLQSFDWSVLKGVFTIVVNKAFKNVPEAKVLYFSDGRFWGWFGRDVAQHPAFKVSISAENHNWGNKVHRLKATGGFGLDKTPGCIRHGNNSGTGAINVAYHCGSLNVYLLGFDMQPDSKGNTHYHGGYPIATKLSAFDKMLPYFPRLAAELEGINMRVINVVGEPRSRIDAFPLMTLTEFEERCRLSALGIRT